MVGPSLICVALFVSSATSSERQDTQQNEAKPLTIGVIANGLGQVSNYSKSGYNITTVWSLVDTTEHFSVFATVQQFESSADIDVIVLFDLDAQLQHDIMIMTSGLKRLLVFEHLKEIDRHEVADTASSEEKSCALPISRDEGEPYCERDTGEEQWSTSSLSEYISSWHLATSISTTALTQMIVETLHWTSVYVLHDNVTERETMQLVDALSLEGTMAAIYNIDTTPDFNATLAQIYHATARVKPEMNFVVICRSRCVRTVLQTANRFDSHRLHTTLLKQFSRWLIAEHGHARDASRVTCYHGDDLDNVVILAIPDVMSPSTSDLRDILDAVVTDLTDNVERNSTLQENDSNRALLDLFEKKAKLWHPSARCKGYKIDTLLWTTTGREFNTVGSVDVRGRLNLQSELFPNIKYGYNKRQFTVATLPWDPFVMKRTEIVRDEKTGEPTGNVTVHYEGLTMDLLKELARILNFTYVIVEPEDQKWGVLVIPENHTFNGLIGMLQRLECDLVAAPISIQSIREVVVDFSDPYFYEYNTVLVKKPDQQALKWRTLVDPLRAEVILAIGGGLCIVTLLIYLLERYNPFYDCPVQQKWRATTGGLHYVYNSFWHMYGCLVYQGGVQRPGSIAGRTFISCWWLTCIVVVGIYCGNLIAFLTVTKEKPPFNTLEEMVEMTEYKYGTLGATSGEYILLTSGRPVFKKIADGFRKFNKTDPGVLDTRYQPHFDRIKGGGYAWIGDTTAIDIAVASECDLIRIKQEFIPLKYAIAFPEGSPQKIFFSEQILKIHESGLLQFWKRKWWPTSNSCKPGKASEATPISLVDVQSAFYACAFGICVAAIASLAEHAIYRLRRSRKPTTDENSIETTARSTSD